MKKKPNAGTSAREKQIDDMVYALYWQNAWGQWQNAWGQAKCMGSGKMHGVRQNAWGQAYSATGQGRIIQRVRIPSRKVSQPPGSESLEGGR